MHAAPTGIAALRAATVAHPAIGCFVFSRDAAVTDVAGHAGMDFVIVDLEHTALSVADVQDHVRAAHRTGIAVLVRLPGHDPGVAFRVLDAGASGVVVPHFGLDAARDEDLLAQLRYAPKGRRAACSGVPAARYGLGNFGEIAARANEEIYVMAQIEDREALGSLDAILARHPIDALMPGPSDLAASYGVPGQMHDARVAAAVLAIQAAAKRAGCASAQYLIDAPVSGHEAARHGAQILVHSIDLRILGRALGQVVQALRSPC